jgi:hypothetical protein
MKPAPRPPSADSGAVILERKKSNQSLISLFSFLLEERRIIDNTNVTKTK